MKIKLHINNIIISLLILMILKTEFVESCEVKSFVNASMLNDTINFGTVNIARQNWTSNRSANVSATNGQLQCEDSCQFINSLNNKIGDCNISRVNTTTYNLNWTNIESPTSMLSIKCKIIDNISDHYYVPQTYSFVFISNQSTCNRTITANPAKISNNITIARNSTHVNTSTLYKFNYAPPNLLLYDGKLYLKIKYLTLQKLNTSVTYITQNQSITESVTFSNDEMVFSITNATIRSLIQNITFDLIYFHPVNYQNMSMFVNLSYEYQKNNYTIAEGEYTFNNSDAFVPIPPNSPNSAFNISSIYSQKDYLIKIRANQSFGFQFNITVNRTNCLPENYVQCLNLFDTMIIQMFPGDPPAGFRTNNGSVNISSNSSQNLSLNIRNGDDNLTLTVQNVTLSEGLNRVYVSGIQSPFQQIFVSVRCSQKINNTPIDVANIIFYIVLQQVSLTYVREINLSINDLNGSLSSQLNQPQQFDLKITLKTPLNFGDYVIIKIPKEYTYLKSNLIKQTDNYSLCGANYNYKCYNGANNSHQIIVIGAFSNTSFLIVSINNKTYLSPKNWGTFTPFQVNTYFSTGEIKDYYNESVTKSATFYLKCFNPTNKCKECDTNGSCLSCYSTELTQVSAPYLAQGQCRSNCSSPCATCSVYASNCTSCQQGQSLLSINNQDNVSFSCIAECPSQFISINSVCKPCIECKTCAQNQFTCLSCQTNKYLLNNSCLQSCPASYLIVGNECKKCGQNCFECSVSTDNCTACLPGFYFLNNKCLSQCPSSYYSYQTPQALLCLSCCQGCSACTNSSYCQICSSGYFPQLYADNNTNICVKNCSTKRIFANNNCNTFANQSSQTNTSNPTNITDQNSSNNSSQSSSQIKALTALPCTLLMLLGVLLAGGSRLVFPETNLFSFFTSVSGVLQVVSWSLTLSIFLANNFRSQLEFSDNAKIILFSALSLNLVISLIGFFFFKSELLADVVFYRHYSGLKNLMSARFYLFISSMLLLMSISNKAVEILFSNLFGIKCFSFRLKSYSQILKHNYLRYASLIPSTLALVVGVMSLLSLSNKSLISQLLFSLIDLCIIIVFSTVVEIGVTFRKQEDYQVQTRMNEIDINQQISNQPASDIPNIQQRKITKQLTPTKSKSPIKTILQHCSKKKANLLQQQIHETQEYIRPFQQQEVVFTEEHFQEKDIDEHSNHLNQTRVTTKVYVSKLKKIINDGNQANSDYRENILETKLTKVRSNRRQKQRGIKQFIGDQNQNLKQQVRSLCLPEEIKILKQILNINEIYEKVIISEKQQCKQSEANLNDENTFTTADKLQVLVKFNKTNHSQVEGDTELALRQLDLAADLMAHKHICLQKMFKYFQLVQKEQSESLKQNYCSNESTPYVNNYLKNEVVLSKGSRYNSRQARKKTKRRRSNFKNGPKMFIQNETGDLSPYVADFYAHQEYEVDNCQLQKEQIDQNGQIDAEHCGQIDHQPVSLMKAKQNESLDNTGSSQIYIDFKKANNDKIQSISKSQQLQINRSYMQMIGKIGSSVPLKNKIEADHGIPESCQLDEDNVDYLQTDRYAGTQMKPYDLEEEENQYFQNNIVNRMQEEFNDRTPCRPQIPVIESRILCGSQEITNQFRQAEPVSKIMSRYGRKQVRTINKKHLPPLNNKQINSRELNGQNFK